MAIKVSTYTGLTNVLTGLVTLQIKIPGTFGGLNQQVSGFQGRRLVKIGAWFEARAAQDLITSLAISDLDSKLPSPYTGSTLTNLVDQTVGANNRALALPPGGPFILDFPTDPTNPSYAKAIVCSEIYLVATFQKAIIGVDLACINIAWDDFS